MEQPQELTQELHPAATPSPNGASLANFPDTAIFCLVTKLNDLDFGIFLQVCQKFASFSRNELFWMHRTTALCGKQIPKPEQTWKEVYSTYSRRVSLNASPEGMRRITVPHSDQVWSKNEFSLCCWVNLSTETDQHDVICNKSDDTWECGFGVDVTQYTADDEKFKIQAFVNQWQDLNEGENPDMVISSQSVSPGEWFHVAVVCSSTQLTIYVNGIKGQQVDITKPVEWSDVKPFTVGYVIRVPCC